MHSQVNETITLQPAEEFYSIFSVDQVEDILNDLKQYNEISRQYNYFSRGAMHWNAYVQSMISDEHANTLTRTIELLDANTSHICSLVAKFNQVNVIDVGAGNSYPIRNFMQRLIDQNRVRRYVALDISSSMIGFAKSNFNVWFGDSVIFEAYEHDITKDDIPRFDGSAHRNGNLIFILGGTFSNLREPDGAYKIIHKSMSKDDILVHISKLDTEDGRKQLNFNSSSDTELSQNHKTLFRLLQIDDDFYDVEKGYDSEVGQRYIRVRLNISIKLCFVINNKKRNVFLKKNSVILLWRGIHHTDSSLSEQFTRNGFRLLHKDYTKDKDYVLTLSRVL